ncbi:uncharacterized protein [Panulirus ornatus]|uniref:uncharacterized protein n=1 Tax=Panulirus ornatus TaxID=150431 RepID=UPI003A843306
MLPSASSPVESASTPVNLTGNLACQPQPLGHAEAGQVVDVSREEYQISSTVDLGMCGVGETSQERGDVMPPPDLCASKRHNYGELLKQSSISCDSDTEATNAQVACDTEFVTSLSHSKVAREDAMEGAWGVTSHSCEESSDGLENSSGASAAVGTKASLPDLCDTSGTCSRVHLSSDVESDSGRDLKYNLSSVVRESHSMNSFEKTCSESQIDNLCRGENGEMEEEAINSSVSNNGSETMFNQSENVDERSASTDSANVSVVKFEPCNVEGDSFRKDESSNYSDDKNIRDAADTSENIDISSKDFSDLEGATGPLEDYLVHDNKEISLVACGITQCDPSFHHDVEMAVLTEDEQGINLIRHNLHHSSHPMFNKWPCYFYITQEHLQNFSIDSHGRHIGSEAPPIFFPSPSVSRPPSQLTEEEQVKIAKRMGLITHLPCGIFDGTKKSGECVICMIDFTVGDRVRYLPCMHTYHTECIDDWLMRSFTCPSCLEPVDAALLNTYGSS